MEKKYKILIVDDSKMTRNFHAYILKSAGFNIKDAENGFDALEKALIDKFDLIITDINMPKMDGYTFIQRLRENDEYRDTPVIIISTEDEAEDKRKGFEAGADFYIVKPVTPEKLLNTIKMFLKID